MSPKVNSRPLPSEKLYVNESLGVTGKLDKLSQLQTGQLSSDSDISDNSSRYFLLIQVDVHNHRSHKSNILSLILGLLLFSSVSTVAIYIIVYYSIIYLSVVLVSEL
ncbi:MAG TPA: hypothetical protein VH481_08110 [Nitrososphaeraceae archaeon]